MTPLPRAAGRALRSAALLACLAGAALGQDSAAARRNEARALADHDRVMLHTGSPLDLRGIEEDGNDFRARTPALARASRTMAMVDADENYRRRREMYESGARFSAPHIVIATGGRPVVPDIPGAEFGIERADLQDAREAVTSVEAELAKLEPDTEAVKAGISRILGLALRLTKWIGERTTKFVDAVLVAGAPVAVAKVTGLLPAIINAVEAVGRAVGH